MAAIHVNTPDGSGYDILIERGLLSRIPEQIGEGRAAVITNTTLRDLYGPALSRALPDAAILAMRDGEPYKTLDTVAELYSGCIDAGLDRSSTLIGFGGGVVGDVAGFVAATYMRGVDFVQMPTSLLAMVDSSVGGKVGVDLPQGKNLVGAFKQPVRVLIDPDVLNTLPDHEWRNGMAEVIKHGLLADEGLLDASLHTLNQAEALIRRAVQVKVEVVQRDPYERGERAHLNLGHTFAHAVEQVSGYRWPHGEAVGFGLVAAARLSHRLAMCPADLPQRVESIVGTVGLPVRMGDMDPEAIYAAMGTDKKWVNGRSRFVLLRGVGQPEVVRDVPAETVLQVLYELR